MVRAPMNRLIVPVQPGDQPGQPPPPDGPEWAPAPESS
jgi:hypothetical protein